MGGMVINTHSERCHICGELFRKGERAYSARPLRINTYGTFETTHLAYPTHGGGVSLRRTFRHPTCEPG